MQTGFQYTSVGFFDNHKVFYYKPSCTAQKLFLWEMFSSAPSKTISWSLQWKMKLIMFKRQTPLTWRRSLSHLLIIFKVPKTFYLVDKIKTKKNKLSIHWWMQTNFKLFPNVQYGGSIPSWPWSVTGTVKGIKQRRKMNGYLRILQSPKVTTSTQNSHLLKASETAIHHTDTAVSRYRPF